MDWWRKKKKKKNKKKQILERGAMLLEDLIECYDGKSNPIKFFSAYEILKATENFSKSNEFGFKWYSVKNENHHKILLKNALHTINRECCDAKSNPIKFFSADEIIKATDNFSDSNRVSELLDFGYKWYSGKNENQHDIAVSSMVSGHKNFLKLVGCCLELEKPVIVYHGVNKHYNLDISEQPWKKRMKIAEDIATALAYLHTAFPMPFVHRSLSLGDILLDDWPDETEVHTRPVRVRKPNPKFVT